MENYNHFTEGYNCLSAVSGENKDKDCSLNMSGSISRTLNKNLQIGYHVMYLGL